jgi:histone H2B
MSNIPPIVENPVSSENPSNKNSEGKKDKRKKHKSQGFTTYIHRVLKQVHPENGITKKALQQLNSMLSIIAEEFYLRCRKMTIHIDKKTISSREVQSVTRLLLPDELAKHAVSEGTKAITKCNAYITEDGMEPYNSQTVNGKKIKRRAEMREYKAGITFSVSKCEKFLRGRGSSKLNVGAGASVYLAAVLEYLAAEILELAGNACRDSGRVNLITRHIFLAIVNDEELSLLMRILNIEFANSGVQEIIHEGLVSKKKKKYEKKESQKGDARKPHRFLPGTVALREIRKYQKSTDLILQKAPFERNIRSFAGECREDIRFSAGVPESIQGFIELRMAYIFADAQALAIHAGRQGINAEDMKLAFQRVVNNSLKTNMGTKMPESVPLASLKHLSRRGGVKIVGGDVYEEAENQMAIMMETLTKAFCTFVEHSRAVTVFEDDVMAALQMLGYNYIM